MVVFCLGKKESKIRQKHQCLKITSIIWYRIFHPRDTCPIADDRSTVGKKCLNLWIEARWS